MSEPRTISMKHEGIYRTVRLSPEVTRHLIKKFGDTLEVARLCRVDESVIYNALPTEKARYADTL